MYRHRVANSTGSPGVELSSVNIDRKTGWELVPLVNSELSQPVGISVDEFVVGGGPSADLQLGTADGGVVFALLGTGGRNAKSKVAA